MWFADRELCGVDADSQATGARGDVVASESALATFIEESIGVERERMCGDDGAAGEELLGIGLELSGHNVFDLLARLIPRFARNYKLYFPCIG